MEYFILIRAHLKMASEKLQVLWSPVADGEFATYGNELRVYKYESIREEVRLTIFIYLLLLLLLLFREGKGFRRQVSLLVYCVQGLCIL